MHQVYGNSLQIWMLLIKIHLNNVVKQLLRMFLMQSSIHVSCWPVHWNEQIKHAHTTPCREGTGWMESIMERLESGEVTYSFPPTRSLTLIHINPTLSIQKTTLTHGSLHPLLHLWSSRRTLVRSPCWTRSLGPSRGTPSVRWATPPPGPSRAWYAASNTSSKTASRTQPPSTPANKKKTVLEWSALCKSQMGRSQRWWPDLRKEVIVLLLLL